VEHLLCFSHLRWNFVYQRPQHLLSRASRHWPIWFIEEPEWGTAYRLEIKVINDRLRVVVPHLPNGIDAETAIERQRQLLDELLLSARISRYVAWYYTPMAYMFSNHLRPELTVYDCMDELSAFAGASPLLLDQEKQLLRQADLVFTGGYSLFEAKQKRHPRVFAFPSCIDFEHFRPARQSVPDPADQCSISGVRAGFCGVIDERLDLALLDELARRRPDWQFILLGPVVKICPDSLPRRPNLHYLGMKDYKQLPAYFSNWDVAMLPFAMNTATRYISPTKTPEYLAAGLPVVSTPIRDVVRTYGGWEQVGIADSAAAFERTIDQLIRNKPDADWNAIDTFLREQSWEHTWEQMQRLMQLQLQGIITEQ